MMVKQVLELTPQQASGMMADSLGARCVVGVEAAAQCVHIAFKSKRDRKVYVLVVKGDKQWLSEFLSAPTSTFQSQVTNSIREFTDAGLRFWPAEQAFMRMRAIMDFRTGYNRA